MRTECGGANRTRATEFEMTIIRTNTNQISIPIGIDLDPTNEEDIFVPILHSIKTMPSIAVRLRPPHHPPIPAKGGHRKAVQMRDIHTRTQKDEFHTGAMHDMRKANRSFHYRHRHSHTQHLTIV